MPAKIIYEHIGGFDASLSQMKDGWSLGLVSMHPVDEEFVNNMDQREWEACRAVLKKGLTYEEWGKAYTDAKSTFSLLTHVNQEISTIYSTQAEQFSGIDSTNADTPLFIWSCFNENIWSVHSFENGSARNILSSKNVLLDPSICLDNSNNVCCAWVERTEEDIIHIQSSFGKSEIVGRHPSIFPLKNGIGVVFERFVKDHCDIYFAIIGVNGISAPIKISSDYDMNFLPKVAVDNSGKIFVAWEVVSRWKFDINVDQIKNIQLRVISSDGAFVEDAPGVNKGILPIPIRSYIRHKGDGKNINMTPSNPKLAFVNDELICSFRIYQHTGNTGYVSKNGEIVSREENEEWIVDGAFNENKLEPAHYDKNTSLIESTVPAWFIGYVKYDGNKWIAPKMETVSGGFSHNSYGICADSEGFILALPSLKAGLPVRYEQVDVLHVSGDMPELHGWIDDFPGIAINPANPIMEPDRTLDISSKYKLAFGDFHDHTSHSSCYPALDGSPPDNVSIQRDLMNNEIISIADHHRISEIDYRRRLDLLEREQTPGHVPIYGLEFAQEPWQHINFFTYEKKVMEELRQILYGNHDIYIIFDEIARNYKGRATAIRHFHAPSDMHTYLFNPDVEWGMEVLRGRGDCLATEDWMHGVLEPKLPFPLNFIHGKNAKLGMIGASDHHMSTLGACLTGVWTEELSGKAIFDAMSKRRVFAVANGKMVIWIESGDVQMGEVGKCEGNTTQIRAEVSSPVPIDAISLLQDGKYIEHKRFNEKKVTVVFDVGPLSKGEHYFLIRVQSHSSSELEKGPILGYCPPVWLNVDK